MSAPGRCCGTAIIIVVLFVAGLAGQNTNPSRSPSARKPLPVVPTAKPKTVAPHTSDSVVEQKTDSPAEAPKATTAKASTTRKAKPRVSPAAKRRAAIAAATANREKATREVTESLAEASPEHIHQAAALVPFFELLYRQENLLAPGPVRILQYGDSHTAGDTFTSSIRTSLQARFGDGGSGFSHAGAPWRGYRRFDVTSKASRGWQSAGLVGRASLRGDEFQGLSGVSVSTRTPAQWISLEAHCSSLEVFYLSQPGGGRFALYDNEELVVEHSTDGEQGPGILQLPTTSGFHHFRIETLDAAPVRLFGWVAEYPRGITYEPLGINGAQATITARWNPQLFRSFVAHRDPSLVVVAYGTNEAGQTVWTYDKYYAEFCALLERIREATPSASILVVGPPDRLQYVRRRGYREAPRLDVVIRAQRDAARRYRAAFWDSRARMGGPGSIRDWVRAGLAARDHVHFSSTGYRRLGELLYQDLMVQYNEFTALRSQWATSDAASIHTESQLRNHESTPTTDPGTGAESLQED
jgi:lysophospholipase L1-like esterase